MLETECRASYIDDCASCSEPLRKTQSRCAAGRREMIDQRRWDEGGIEGVCDLFLGRGVRSKRLWNRLEKRVRMMVQWRRDVDADVPSPGR